MTEIRRAIESVDFTAGVPTLMMRDSLWDIASGIYEDMFAPEGATARSLTFRVGEPIVS